MTWKHLAKKSNSLPPGWSTAEDIAADLDCEPNEVPKILASAIRDGLVDKQTFPHWQPGSRQLLYQTGYRQKTSVSAESKAPSAAPASIAGIPADLLPKVQDKILAHPHKTASAIKDLFSTNNRSRLSVKAIRSLLDKPSHNRK